MADINIARSHSLPLAVAKAKVVEAVKELAAETKVKAAWEWEGNRLLFEAPGLKGEIHVTPSEIQLQANLGLLMKPLKQRFVNRIQDEFETLLPAAKAGTRRSSPQARRDTR